MHDGWREARLGDVATLIMGQSPPGPSYNTEGRGLPFIQGSAEFGVHHPMPVKWCDAPRKVAQAGDLLVSVRAPVGDLNQADRTLAIGRGLAIVRGRGTALTPFLSLAIEHRQDELRSRSGGGMFQSATRAGLAGLPLLLPPLDEQRRIVDLISTADEAIDAASKVADAARKARRALLSNLLSDERARTEQWRSARLGEIAKVVHGGTPKTSNPAYWNGDIPWVRPIDITAATSNRITDTPKHISAEGLARSSASLLPSGSIIVSTRGTIGLIALNERPMATNQSCEGLIVDNTSLSDYVALWLGAHRNDLRSRASGTTIAGLAPTALRDVPILIPELDEQRHVVGIINAVDNEIDAAEAVAKHTRALRSALLSDLLSGKHEIPVSYDEVLELAA